MAILTSVRWYLIVVSIQISLVISDADHLFMSLLSSICCHWINVCLGLLPIFLLGCLVFWLLNLYGLETKPFSFAAFGSILSHSVGCLHFCFIVFIAAWKLVSLIRSHVFTFCFLYLLPCKTDLRKHLCSLCQNVLPMFSSRSFIVSCLMLKSLSHFEFISIHGVKVCSNFIDLHATVPNFPVLLAEETLFFPFSCLLFQKLFFVFLGLHP